MKLKNLEIKIGESYSDHPGQYRGNLTFNDSMGEVKILLDSEMSAKILAIVADEIVITSKKIAQELTSKCIDSIATGKQLALDKSEAVG